MDNALATANRRVVTRDNGWIVNYRLIRYYRGSRLTGCVKEPLNAVSIVKRIQAQLPGRLYRHTSLNQLIYIDHFGESVIDCPASLFRLVYMCGLVDWCHEPGFTSLTALFSTTLTMSKPVYGCRRISLWAARFSTS